MRNLKTDCEDDTHPSAIDGVVNASEFLDGRCDEVLNALLITYIQLDNKGLVAGVSSEASAFFGDFLKAFNVDIREDNTFCPSFRKSERGLFTDTGSGLSRPR